MAKASDLHKDSKFSPEEKDIRRQLSSAGAALLALPTLLGIIKGQTSWISSGSWQSFKEHFGKQLQGLFDVVDNSAPWEYMGGGKSMFAQVTELKKKIIEDLQEKGSSTFKKVDPPDFVGQAEEFADRRTLLKEVLSEQDSIWVSDRRTRALTYLRDFHEYIERSESQMYLFTEGSTTSFILGDEAEIWTDTRLQQIREEVKYTRDVRWRQLERAHLAAHEGIHWNLTKQLYQAGTKWDAPIALGGITEEDARSATAAWERKQSNLINKWADEPFIDGVMENYRFIDSEDMKAHQRTLRKFLGTLTKGTSGYKATLKQIADLADDIRMYEWYESRINLPLDKKKVEQQAYRAYVQRIRAKVKLDIDKKVQDEVKNLVQDKNLVNRFKTLRKAISIVNSTHGTMLDVKPGLHALSRLSSDLEVIRFIEEEASPRYIRELNKVVTKLIKKDSDFLHRGTSQVTATDHLRTGGEIYKELTDHEMGISGNAGGPAEVKLYKTIKGKKIHVGSMLSSGVETVKTTLSEEQLSKVIRNRLEDYTVGLSSGERMRIGNVSVFNKKMEAMKKSHSAIFGLMNQGALYDQVNNYGAYAEQLSKGVKNLEVEILKIKAEVNRLNALAVTGDDTASAALRIMAKGSQMNPNEFIDALRGMSVELEIKSTLRGDVPLPTADLVLNVGKRKIRQSFSIERFGMFLPNKYNRVHSTAILLPVGGTAAKDAASITLAMIKTGISNAGQIMSDIIDSGLDPASVERRMNYRPKSYRQLVGPRTGHQQDVIRGTKVISDEMAVLSGTKSPFFYRNYAAGKTSWFTGTDIYNTDTPTVSFDFEFNAPQSGAKGSQLLIKDSRTRIYWMNYITKKGGSNERIFNHFIRPENWEDIRESVMKFMVHKQPGEGFEMYQTLNETFQEAWLDMEENGVRKRFVDVNVGDTTTQERISQLTGEKTKYIRIYSDEGGVLEMAKNIYNTADGKLAPGSPVWLGHNIREADLPLLNKSVKRTLDSINAGKFKVSVNEKRLLERMFQDTHLNTILSKGNFIDTYSLSALAHADSYMNRSLSLTSVFDQLMEESIDDGATRREGRSAKVKFNSESWTTNLSQAVKKSNGRITSEIKHLIQDLPDTLQQTLTNWIKENPKNVVFTFSQGMAHHSGHFDTRAVMLLKDLLFWKMDTIKHRNPVLYDSIMAVGNTAEGIVNGKMSPWNRAIEIFDKSSLGNFPEGGVQVDPRAERVFSHLFALTPTLASKGIGALMGPENYLPFGQYTNLLKQMYQVQSASSLAPGLAAREAKVFAGMAPAIQRSLEDVHASSMWTTSIGAQIANTFAEGEQRLGALQSPVRSRFHAMTAYLPSVNDIVGQDTGLFTSPEARALAREFPMGTEGVHVSVYHEAGNKLAQKNTTVVRWLKNSGISSDVIKMVQDKYGAEVTLGDLMADQQKGSITLNLRMSDKERLKVLTGTKQTNVLSPGETFFRARQVADDIITTQGDKLIHDTKYNINNPLKYASVLEEITYDFDKATFVFDATPVESPEIVKIVDSMKMFKGNVVGQAAGLRTGKGIGLILGSKKPNLANMIDIHMRRSLSQIHNKDMTVPHQKKLIKNMLMKTWNLSEIEYEATFKLKIMPLAANEKFKNGLVVPELKSNYTIDLQAKTIMKNVRSMLKHSGVTYATMKEMFIEQNADILRKYKSDIDIREQLSNIYDDAVRKQKKVINDLAINIDVSTSRGQLIVEMQKIIKETDIALYDPVLFTEDYLIDVKAAQTNGLIDSETGSLVKGVRVEAAAHVVRQEFGVSEVLKDFGTFNTRPVDAYGLPVKKTFSIWQTMVIYNASRNNEYFKDHFMRHAMADAGIMDKNVKKVLHTHLTALNALSDGYVFDSERTKTISLEQMQDDISRLSKLQQQARGTATRESRISAWMAARKTSREEAARIVDLILQAEAEDSFVLKGTIGELYKESEVFQLNMFDTIDRRTGGKARSFNIDYLKLELPSLEGLKKYANKGTMQIIKDAQAGARAHLMQSIRDTLRQKAGDLGAREAAMLEQTFRQMPGSFTGPLNDLLLPQGGPLGLPEGYILEGSSRARVEMESIITKFNKETSALMETGKGITPNQIERTVGHFNEMISQLAPRLLTSVYANIPVAQWKAAQVYGRGQQFAKAVDATVYVKQGLGNMLLDAEMQGKSMLSQKVFMKGDPVLQALNKLKSNIPRGATHFQSLERAKSLAAEFGYDSVETFLNEHEQGKTIRRALDGLKSRKGILDEMITATKKITLGDILEGITADPRDSSKSLMKVVDDQGFFIAKGTGVGETILPSSQFAASITSGDPILMLAELTEGNDAVAAWKRMLTGRQRMVDLVARNPMFENTFGALFANAYIYHDELFRNMGIKDDLSRILLVNGIDLALQRGDFDGDLVSRMLLTARVDLKEGTLLDPYNIARGKGYTIEQGMTEQLDRIQQKLFDRAMVQGKEAVQYGGQNLLKLEKIASGTDMSRILVQDTAVDVIRNSSNRLFNQISEGIDAVVSSEAQGQLGKKGLMYMVQQLLTGRIGEKQKMYDMLFTGPNPAAKNDVVMNLMKHLGDPVLKKHQVQERLTALGIDNALVSNDPKRAAGRYITQLQDAWSILNSSGDYKTFNYLTEDWYTRRGTRKLDLVHEWVRVVTHELPIEKEKTGVVSNLIKATQDFNKFMRGGSDSRANIHLGEKVWDSFAIENARASKIFINPESSVFNSSQKIEAERYLVDVKKQFLAGFDSQMQVNDAVTRMTTAGLVMGQDSMYLASNKPKEMVYAALSDAFGIGAAKERQWLGSEISNFFSSSSFNSVASAEAARDVLYTQMTPALDGGGWGSLIKRASSETTGKFISSLTKGLAHQRWTKRAAIGMMAFALLDPNTNSLMVPGQRGRGEEYDIPNLSEITSGYNQRAVKFKEYSPPLMDKMARSLGLPYGIGSSGRVNPYLPPEPRRVHHVGVDHNKRNQASMQQLVRQVNGILL